MKKSGVFFCLYLFFAVFFPVHGQSRGSIPETLLRPAWGESSRYPIDIVIGELGQGGAPYQAFIFAGSISEGLLSGQVNHPALVSIAPVLRENYLSVIGSVNPREFRLGSGRQEPDGAVSFLVRFIGRDYGITGELYVRLSDVSEDEFDNENQHDGLSTESQVWLFDELLLEEAKSRDAANQEAFARLDRLPYERFY